MHGTGPTVPWRGRSSFGRPRPPVHEKLGKLVSPGRGGGRAAGVCRASGMSGAQDRRPSAILPVAGHLMDRGGGPGRSEKGPSTEARSASAGRIGGPMTRACLAAALALALVAPSVTLAYFPPSVGMPPPVGGKSVPPDPFKPPTTGGLGEPTPPEPAPGPSVQTPEPASMVTALTGVVLAIGYAARQKA